VDVVAVDPLGVEDVVVDVMIDRQWDLGGCGDVMIDRQWDLGGCGLVLRIFSDYFQSGQYFQIISNLADFPDWFCRLVCRLVL